jgi:alkanesulfonate monooxygenase SsuD/methylene tetrahydromethanopterin reductase-like flavin-dependent oxidoreductase (luciferase family)
MRLAERISIVDHLSDGRLLLGLGRGLARREYEGFGVDMEESRDRFNETANMLLQGLETGRISAEGQFFTQRDEAVYPEPNKNFRDRTYVIAMSPPSIAASAEFGGTLMCFNYQYPIEQQAEEFNAWRELYKQHHGVEAPPPVLLDFMYCHEDAEVADQTMRNYLGPFFNAMVDHYEFDGKHFASSEKYNHYATGAEAILAAGRQAAFDGFYGLQWTGTPEKMIEQMKQRIDLIGEFSQMVLVSFGGMEPEKVYASLELFMDKVVPAVNEYADAAKARVTVSA